MVDGGHVQASKDVDGHAEACRDVGGHAEAAKMLVAMQKLQRCWWPGCSGPSAYH